MARTVLTVRTGPRARPELLVLLVLLVATEHLGRTEPQEPLVLLDKTVTTALRVRLVLLDLRGFLVPLVSMAASDPLAVTARTARMVPPAWQDRTELMVRTARQAFPRQS